MPFTICRNDITKMKTDAIVNAANAALQMGGGVCGAIYRAAGVSELQAACSMLAPLHPGEAVITPGFRLPAKFIIHAAGPVYRDGLHGEEQLLRSCYLRSMEVAVENGCRSIAFPLISSGIYGYPKDQALAVAVAAIRDFLAGHELDVFLAVFDKASLAVSESLLGEIKSYIDEYYVDEHQDKQRRAVFRDSGIETPRPCALYDLSDEKGMTMPSPGLDDWIVSLDEPFSAALLRLIDLKGKSDVDVYKRANLDRKHFSKIRTGKGYMPGKRTAIALAVALELTLGETADLLKRAGYALSHSQKSDVIVEYFILHGIYDIYEINEMLFKYDQPLLGG